MLSKLKNHPFAVQAFFKQSIVLTFAVPTKEAKGLLPPCLEPDTFQDEWSFVAVAMVQTTNLRPKGFPAVLGNDFFLIGYRMFVKYYNTKGKRLRGLYILKSETDRKKMEFLGNLFTHYNYTTTDIEKETESDRLTIRSKQSDFEVVLGNSNEEITLPKSSPFANWKEARRYAGPLPFTFSYDSNNKQVTIIEGKRQNWNPAPLEVQSNHFSFLDTLGFSQYRLANAFLVENIPYSWSKGKVEIWEG